jgi:hypothetical protein
VPDQLVSQLWRGLSNPRIHWRERPRSRPQMSCETSWDGLLYDVGGGHGVGMTAAAFFPPYPVPESSSLVIDEPREMLLECARGM